MYVQLIVTRMDHVVSIQYMRVNTRCAITSKTKHTIVLGVKPVAIYFYLKCLV